FWHRLRHEDTTRGGSPQMRARAAGRRFPERSASYIQMRYTLAWLMAAGLLTAGCEINTTTTETSTAAGETSAAVEANSETGTSAATNEAPVNTSAAQQEWNSIAWHSSEGPSCEGAPQVMTITAEIFDGGSKVRFTWDHFPWSGAGLV